MKHAATARGLAGLLLTFAGMQAAWAPVVAVQPRRDPVPVPAAYSENEFAPDGSKCPGACGEGCPDTCEHEEFRRCDNEHPNLIEKGERYSCGTHELCTSLEGCLDACNGGNPQGSDALGILLGIAPAYAPVVKRGWLCHGNEECGFGPASCQSKCSADAKSSATALLGGAQAGASAVSSWSLGGGPYDGAGVWDYTIDQPGAPEHNESCKACETCQDGRCVRDDEACPAPRPGGPEPAPMVSSGDAHVTSLDRLRFDLQSVGEFVLIEDDSRQLIVQTRTRPVGDSVSVNSAVAMQVAGDVVGIYIEPSITLHVNGAAVDLAEGGSRTLDHGGKISRRGHVYVVAWPDGSDVEINVNSSNLSVGARLAPELAGKVHGIAGNFNRNPDDDMTTRDGEVLPRRPDRELLYDRFGNSWRIAQDESLFEYGEGESTATFTRRDFPLQKLSVDSLDPSATAEAEAACARVNHPRLYRDCVLDVALTGDTSFVATHAQDAPPAVELPPPWLDGVTSSDITVESPASAAAGSDVTVRWAGTRRIGDYVVIARDKSPMDAFFSFRVVQAESPVILRAPRRAGRYVVRYVQGNAAAAESDIDIIAPPATLSAPAQAPSGSQIDVDWTGPGGRVDYVAIADAQAKGGKQYNWRHTAQGNPAKVTVPDEPGNYELRYVDGESRAVLATRPIAVTAAAATLDAASEVPSGGKVSITWTGPGNAQDLITIADPDLPGSRQRAYSYAGRGNPVEVVVPDEPGTYELRYVQHQSRTILARRPLVVTAAAATLDAASDVQSGSKVSVTWTGPGNAQDLITLADPETPGNQQRDYSYVSRGNPAELTAPDAPGTYELRYVQHQSRTILARRPITVAAVAATLDADATVQSGGKLSVVWTGPDNLQDYISIATPDAAGNQQHSYSYTNRGSPAMLTAPDEPGQYEIRYVQHQSRNVLARRPITVAAVSATLDAADEVRSGGELSVTWTGPDNDQDYISIAAPQAPGNQQHSYQYTGKGNPATLTAPDEPGVYELRYVQHQSRNALARRRLTVVDVTATLDAPPAAPAGGSIEVTWTGPGNRGDYIAIANPEADGRNQETYEYTSKGNPLHLRMPKAPGKYEVRYVQGQSRRILARRPIVAAAP
jgi:von Willebrand factor type D domain